MIDTNRACEILSQKTSHNFFCQILDVGHGYVISPCSQDGEILEAYPYVIDKKTGKVSVYIVPDNFDELTKSIELDVPKKYKSESK